MRHNHVQAALVTLALFLLFQLAVSASTLVYAGYDLAGPLSDRLNWFAGWIMTLGCYLNPVGIFFAYIAILKWLLIDRRLNTGWAGSVAYYVVFGLYYGVLFMNGLNGELHRRFDRALAMTGSPFSDMFPLALAFLLPLVVTLLVSITLRGRRNAGQSAG